MSNLCARPMPASSREFKVEERLSLSAVEDHDVDIFSGIGLGEKKDASCFPVTLVGALVVTALWSRSPTKIWKADLNCETEKNLGSISHAIKRNRILSVTHGRPT